MKMTAPKKVAILQLLVVALSACAQVTIKPQEPDPFDFLLVDVARDIQAQWAVLGEIEQAKHQESLVSEDTGAVPVGPGTKAYAEYLQDLPPGLETRVTFSWFGQPEAAIRKLCGLVGWSYQEVGQTADLTPMLIEVTEEPVGIVLRDIGYRMGGKAGVVIHDSTKVVELRFLESGYL